MARSVCAVMVLAAALAAARLAAADEAKGEGEGKTAAADEGAAQEEGKEEGPKKYQFVTGLDFSYWAADVGTTVLGPGVSVGFVLLPRHLEMSVVVGAMLGGHQYTIPVALMFTVPFHVNEWLAPFVALGPMLVTDKLQDETTYDFAAAFSAGVELLPLGFDWGLYACGDYNVRTLHDVRHQGGFTVGFHYRV
jgi:opacity protein-like surface antigen